MKMKPGFHAERGESMYKERKESAPMERREKRSGVERRMTGRKPARKGK